MSLSSTIIFSSPIRFPCQPILASVAFNLFELYLRIRYGERVNATTNRCRLERIRALLRFAPAWLDGHLLLAESELLMFELIDGRPEPRSLATVRISLDVVSNLLSGERISSRVRDAFAIRIKYLLGLYTYRRGDYGASKAALESVVGELGGGRMGKALEYLGHGAVVMGEEDRALIYLLRIPASERSREVLQTIDFLQRRERSFLE